MTVTFDGEPALRWRGAAAGTPASRGALGLLRRLSAAAGGVPRDAACAAGGGFAAPVFRSGAAEVEYVVAMPARALAKRARRLMGQARALDGPARRLCRRDRYAAGVARSAGLSGRGRAPPGRVPEDPRFVVTLPPAGGVWLSVARRRGEPAQDCSGLEMDRTSCSRFLANQFRVLLALAAYILFQTLRARLAAGAPAPTPGDHAARAAAEDRRVGRALGAADRPALPADVSVAGDLAAPRACRRRQDVASPSSGCARRTLEAVSLPTRRGCHRQRTVAVIPRLLAHDHAELVTPTPQMHAARPLGAVDRQQVHVHE